MSGVKRGARFAFPCDSIGIAPWAGSRWNCTGQALPGLHNSGRSEQIWAWRCFLATPRLRIEEALQSFPELAIRASPLPTKITMTFASTAKRRAAVASIAEMLHWSEMRRNGRCHAPAKDSRLGLRQAKERAACPCPGGDLTAYQQEHRRMAVRASEQGASACWRWMGVQSYSASGRFFAAVPIL